MYLINLFSSTLSLDLPELMNMRMQIVSDFSDIEEIPFRFREMANLEFLQKSLSFSLNSETEDINKTIMDRVHMMYQTPNNSKVRPAQNRQDL